LSQQKIMVRTNQTLLEYAGMLYNKQSRKEDIIVKNFANGQVLLRQNMPAAKVIIVKEGITKCYLTESNDKTYIIEFLGKGEVIGELECIRNIPCLCSVEAVTDVFVYAFSVSYFQYLLQTDLQLNHYLLDSFAGRIINTSIRSSFQQLYTVEHSLKKLLELQSKHGLTLSKEEMASYLGITVRTLNRGIRNLSV